MTAVCFVAYCLILCVLVPVNIVTSTTAYFLYSVWEELKGIPTGWHEIEQKLND